MIIKISTKCSKCKINDRYVQRSNGMTANWCKECQSRQSQISYNKYKKQRLLSNLEWQRRNKDKVRLAVKKSRNKRRYKILDYYSDGKLECACCKEKNYEFLTIDHINGGGTQHRKDIGNGGQALYSWIINNGYPKGFRVLCYNCNSCYGHYHYCPHQKLLN